jgi:L-serine dehydratase
MESIKSIFRVGYGPSSSHTIAPSRAATIYIDQIKRSNIVKSGCKVVVELQGSLAATGKGHHTDDAIIKTFEQLLPGVELIVEWNSDFTPNYHPNGMMLKVVDGETIVDSWQIYSVGGGAIEEDSSNRRLPDHISIYPKRRMSDILQWCRDGGRNLWEYVEECEGKEIWSFLREIWMEMKATIEKGLKTEGVLTGPLHVQRKAASYYTKAQMSVADIKNKGIIFSYALAVSEENASCGRIVTAPTCGASGVLPAILYFGHTVQHQNEERILRALAIAGLVGNIVKTNGSISGAEVGCQGEIGTACAMGSAAMAYLLGGSASQIEYAAEMGIEHHLGLTCDPVLGYVQIPCIERNAFAADTARESAVYACFSDGAHKVSFDNVVKTMVETGKDMQSKYRETGLGGLARYWEDLES